MEISLNEQEIQLILARATENFKEQLTGLTREKMFWGIQEIKKDKKKEIEFHITIY